MTEVLQTYTIFYDPADPQCAPYAVRQQLIDPGRVRQGWLLAATSLRTARDLVPAHADQQFIRAPHDHPAIVETWL